MPNSLEESNLSASTDSSRHNSSLVLGRLKITFIVIVATTHTWILLNPSTRLTSESEGTTVSCYQLVGTFTCQGTCHLSLTSPKPIVRFVLANTPSAWKYNKIVRTMLNLTRTGSCRLNYRPFTKSRTGRQVPSANWPQLLIRTFHPRFPSSKWQHNEILLKRQEHATEALISHEPACYF